MLVVLRLALGWHFLYEGVWKLTHRDAFLAETEGFLSAARGPAAKLFNRLVPDIDGKQRLEHDLERVSDKGPKEGEGKPENQLRLATRWDEIRADFVAHYRPPRDKGENGDLYNQFEDAAEKVGQRHIDGLEKFVQENGDKIKAHFDSFHRFNDQLKTDPSTDFMRQRRWDQLQEYRKEAKGWTADLEAREKALKADLMDLLNKERTKELQAVARADANDEEAKAAKSAAAAKKTASSEDRQPAKSAAKAKDGKSDDSSKAKSAPGPKPADSPREWSEGTFSVHGGGTLKGDVKFGTWDQPQPKSHSTENGKQEPKAKADKKSPPGAALALIDFSPLAKDRDPAGPFRESRNPFKWPRMEQLAFLLSYGLTAIGLCLILGLFTRLSALAGAAFMLSVVLSQPSYPGVYPPDLPQMGHALLVNKDFVEMISLLVIASSSMGRWTGMDFFLHNCLIRPFCRCCCGRCKSEGEKA